MERIIRAISEIDVADRVLFRIKKAGEIMEEADYSGIRISMEASFDGAVIPLKIDISTGDVITPKEIQYSYKLMFEDRAISIMTYPVETVLAEKLETVISRSITNTRMRDFYDIHMLLESQIVDDSTLALALERTTQKRGSQYLLVRAEEILRVIENSDDMKTLWSVYQKTYKYAENYS